jgi:hypothetical protein
MPYPTDEAGRQQLAAELTAKGYKPTQAKDRFFRQWIDSMVADMQSGTFDWAASALRPIILGPDGEVLGGHHRIIAAHLAGIDMTTVAVKWPQIRSVGVCFRTDYQWIDVLPDVQ